MARRTSPVTTSGATSVEKGLGPATPAPPRAGTRRRAPRGAARAAAPGCGLCSYRRRRRRGARRARAADHRRRRRRQPLTAAAIAATQGRRAAPAAVAAPLRLSEEAADVLRQSGEPTFVPVQPLGARARGAPGTGRRWSSCCSRRRRRDPSTASASRTSRCGEHVHAAPRRGRRRRRGSACSPPARARVKS